MPGKTARSRDQTSFGTAGTPEATAQPTCGFPGNPAVCYRPHCSGVHLGNVGYKSFADALQRARG